MTTSSSLSSSAIAELKRVVCYYDFQKIHLQPVSSPQLELILKIRTIELERKRFKLQIWDTAGQERFKTITTAYYRGAMGMLLVSFNNIRNWIENIEKRASDNVNKILVGNKADMEESKGVVPKLRGQVLANEYGIQFFETSAKTNYNVEQVFFSITRDIKQRLVEIDAKAEPPTIKISTEPVKASTSILERSACCST